MVQNNGIYTLAGIVNRGGDCGDPTKPGIYYNVYYSLPWIYDHLQHKPFIRTINCRSRDATEPRNWYN